MATVTELENAHLPKDVDVSAAGRGVWLVKIPKYLSDQWKKSSPGTDVGKLKISSSRVPNRKPEIVFSSTSVGQNKPSVTPVRSSPASSTSASGSGVTAMVPLGQHQRMAGAAALPASQDYKFNVTNAGSQNLVVMSQAKSDGSNADPSSDKICIEGKVMQRAECHPIINAAYTKQKRDQFKAHNTPEHRVKLLDQLGPTYKPVKSHPTFADDKKTKKAEKRSRAERDKVMDILFNAFEKHQFYAFKDLVGITKQPMPYLKEILKEFCNYNMTGPHKNTWELKPEFRHYKTLEDAADT